MPALGGPCSADTCLDFQHVHERTKASQLAGLLILSAYA